MRPFSDAFEALVKSRRKKAILRVLVLGLGMGKDQKISLLLAHATTQTEITMDSTRIAVLPFEATTAWITGGSQAASLSPEDFGEVERILLETLAKLRPGQVERYEKMRQQYPQEKFNPDNFVIRLERYYRQYVPFLNEQGEKEVYVNCFCNPSRHNWGKDLVDVLDGGNCYFQLRVNLSKGICSRFNINGSA